MESLKFKVNSAFSALSARIIALRIENPYSILRQIANLPQRVIRVLKKTSFSLHFRVFRFFRCSIIESLLVIGYWLLKVES